MIRLVVALIALTSSAFAQREQSAIRFVITSSDVQSATAEFDPVGRPMVRIRFTPEAAQRLERITCANVGKMLELVVDGRVVTTAQIVDCIKGGEVQLSGNFTPEETRQIARNLQPSGATTQAAEAPTGWLEQLWTTWKQLLELILRFFTRVGEQWTY
jgi:preprotein translocase subunit SecD